jgi:hypothetical protein
MNYLIWPVSLIRCVSGRAPASAKTLYLRG